MSQPIIADSARLPYFLALVFSYSGLATTQTKAGLIEAHATLKHLLRDIQFPLPVLQVIQRRQRRAITVDNLFQIHRCLLSLTN